MEQRTDTSLPGNAQVPVPALPPPPPQPVPHWGHGHREKEKDGQGERTSFKLKIPGQGHRSTRYKEKFQAMRERYERVVSVQEEHKRDLDIAAEKMRRLQAENDLLLDAIHLSSPDLIHLVPPASGPCPPEHVTPAPVFSPGAAQVDHHHHHHHHGQRSRSHGRLAYDYDYDRAPNPSHPTPTQTHATLNHTHDRTSRYTADARTHTHDRRSSSLHRQANMSSASAQPHAAVENGHSRASAGANMNINGGVAGTGVASRMVETEGEAVPAQMPLGEGRG